MRYRGNKHEVTIGGMTFWVDSNQEETLIRWLETHGFSERWRHLADGISVNQNNYTPDLELSIEHNGMTHRALVESKPFKAAFTPYVSRRMRAVARHYFTDVLLLYVHDEQVWYRVDITTGELTLFGNPKPGNIPIKKLYKPFTKPARRIYSHTYRQRLAIGKITAAKVADALEFGIKSFFGPKGKRRYRRRKRPKSLF